MGRSSKVMTPRNVELPNHYMTLPTSGSLHPNPGSDLLVAPSPTSSAKKPIEPRKKCLCLSAWLLGLILLCVGIVMIANFLLPMSQNNNQKLILNGGGGGQGTGMNKCLETSQGAASLEQKMVLSDFIVVATLGHADAEDSETKIKVNKVLKGFNRHEVEKHLYLEHEEAPCDLPIIQQGSSKRKPRFVFFLYRSPQDGKWRQRFMAMDSSSKLIEVIETLLEEKGVTLERRGNKKEKKKNDTTAAKEGLEKDEIKVMSSGIGLGLTQGRAQEQMIPTIVFLSVGC